MNDVNLCFYTEHINNIRRDYLFLQPPNDPHTGEEAFVLTQHPLDAPIHAASSQAETSTAFVPQLCLTNWCLFDHQQKVMKIALLPSVLPVITLIRCDSSADDWLLLLSKAALHAPGEWRNNCLDRVTWLAAQGTGGCCETGQSWRAAGTRDWQCCYHSKYFFFPSHVSFLCCFCLLLSIF